MFEITCQLQAIRYCQRATDALDNFSSWSCEFSSHSFSSLKFHSISLDAPKEKMYKQRNFTFQYYTLRHLDTHVNYDLII